MVDRVFRLAIVSGLVIATAMWCTMSSASAQTRADKLKAKRLFSQGNKAFKQGRYSDALASYRTSFTLVERPRTLFNIAVCRDRLGDHEGAYVDYDRFVGSAQKRDAKLAAKAQARVLELKNTLELPVTITSSPPGASVFEVVDGIKTMLGRTPAAVKMRMGSYKLRFEAPEHRATDVALDVVAGKPNQVAATLDSLARITVTTTPAEATVSMLGTTTQASGRVSVVVDPGTYQFEVAHPGYQKQTLAVVVLGRDTVYRHVTLEEVRVEPPPPAPVREIIAPATTRSNGRWLRYGSIGAGVFAVGALALGVSQAFDARDQSRRAQSAAEMGRWDPGAFSAAERSERRMYISYAVSGVSVVAAGIMFYVGHRRGVESRRSRRLVVSPTIGSGAAGVAALGRF